MSSVTVIKSNNANNPDEPQINGEADGLTRGSTVVDQYSDHEARVWNLIIGDRKQRISIYRDILSKLFRDHKCSTVLDVACGTGVDSVWMVEEGFKVTSADLSFPMLRHALKERWTRRKEPGFEDWEIEQANWLTLSADLAKPNGVGFDLVFCLGNSFSHMPAHQGDRSKQQLAIKNFYDMLKPGGYLFIDHRNYSLTLDGQGKKVTKTSYLYESKHIKKIVTSILYVDNQPEWVMMDYKIDVSGLEDTIDNFKPTKGQEYEFRLSVYPHKLDKFNELLETAFGTEAEHHIFGDFMPLSDDDVPVYYQHFIRKPF